MPARKIFLQLLEAATKNGPDCVRPKIGPSLPGETRDGGSSGGRGGGVPGTASLEVCPGLSSHLPFSIPPKTLLRITLHPAESRHRAKDRRGTGLAAWVTSSLTQNGVPPTQGCTQWGKKPPPRMVFLPPAWEIEEFGRRMPRSERGIWEGDAPASRGKMLLDPSPSRAPIAPLPADCLPAMPRASSFFFFLFYIS